MLLNVQNVSRGATTLCLQGGSEESLSQTITDHSCLIYISSYIYILLYILILVSPIVQSQVVLFCKKMVKILFGYASYTFTLHTKQTQLTPVGVFVYLPFLFCKFLFTSSESIVLKQNSANTNEYIEMKYTTIIYPCLLIICCLVSYHHSLRGAFVFDDIVAVVRNKDVIKSPLSIFYVFNHDFWGANLTDPTSHKSYRPLTILLFHFEYNILNFGSYQMKMVNLALHCVNSLLALNLFNKISSNNITSLIGASLFAIHPVHTEAVCGVVGRAELLFCLCFLLAILLMDSIEDDLYRTTNGLKYLGIIILSTAGLLCKENAITILPSCVFYDFIKRRCYRRRIQIDLNDMLQGRYILMAVLSGILLYCRLWIQNFESPKFHAMDNPIASNDSFQTRALSQNFLYALNCWILLCPMWLSFDWALGSIELVSSATDPRILGIILLNVYLYKIVKTKSKTLLIGVGFLIIPFLPASGILKVGFVIAERVLYVPSIGICLIVASAFQSTSGRLSKYKNWLNVTLIALMILFILRTRQRAADWMTDDSLFSSALTVCPNNAKVHYNIARLSTDKGDKKKAFEHYHKAISLYADYEAALMNLGNLYRDMGDHQTAEKFIKKSLNVLENFPAAWMNLGIVQALRKKYTEALQSYRNALKYRKHYPLCYYNMGNLFHEIGEHSEAMKHWQEAVALDPIQPKAWGNILTFLDSQGLYDDAIRLSSRALKYVPNTPSIMFIRANVYGKMKHYVEAEELYKRVIEAEPLNALYHTNMGVLYHRWGKINSAIKSYQNAIKFDSKAKTASDNLSKLLNRRM